MSEDLQTRWKPTLASSCTMYSLRRSGSEFRNQDRSLLTGLSRSRRRSGGATGGRVRHDTTIAGLQYVERSIVGGAPGPLDELLRGEKRDSTLDGAGDRECLAGLLDRIGQLVAVWAPRGDG